RVPTKLRVAGKDAVTKPPEIKSTVVRAAFANISFRFPSEVSLHDLKAFVKANGLGISPPTLRDMVGKAIAKRQNWQARGRDLPVRVLRDTLWVEDVMWALRVRKTRKEFDKWEVNEYRNEWVSILEAATPHNPTVFAAPADHRIVPPLSYTELRELEGPSSSLAPSSGDTAVDTSVPTSAGPVSGGYASGGNASGGFSWRDGSDDSGRRAGRGGAGWESTGSRPVPTALGKTRVPLDSRPPSSVLLTSSRPASAAATLGATAAAGTAATSGKKWGGEGGVGDSTVWCFTASGGGGGGDGGGGGPMGDRGGGARGGGRRSSAMTAQERGLFGRKPSPATVTRSTCFGPRRRPPCSADGRRPRPETASEGTAELYELEADINSSAF
ncbi:unnamed protein product, partial [Laminaria digitata]